MADLASTDVTITPLVVSKRKVSSRIVEIEGTIAFGNSALFYPAAGVPLSTTLGAFGVALPLRQLEFITDRNSTTGTHWYADVSTPASPVLHGWHSGYTPQVIVEEVPTLTGTTTKAGTLSYKPAYIFSATATVSGTIHAMKIIPSTVTAAAKEIKMNMATGAFTSFAETPTVMTFSYIPQQPSGPFAAANMVINEVITNAAAGVNSASRAAAIQYMYQTAATAARIDFANAGASGKVILDINNSSATTFTSNHADNNDKAAVVTYLKYAGFQQPGIEFIDQAAVTLTSEAKEYGKTAGDRVAGLVLPGTGTQIQLLQGATYTEAWLAASTATAAAGRVKLEVLKGMKFTSAETVAATTMENTPLLFLSSLYTSHHGLAELTNAHAPAATTLRYIARF